MSEEKLSVPQLLQIAEILKIDATSLLPSENPQPKTLEEYIRRIIRDEFEKLSKNKE